MRPGRAEMRRGQHRPERRLDGVLRIGEEAGDAGQRLVRLGIKDMQDRADQECVTGLLPVVALLQRAFRIDQDVGDVLDVAHFVRPAADLQQRIVGFAVRIGRIEQDDAAEAGAPTGRQAVVLALDVVDDERAGPGQQGRDDETHALARPGGRETQDVLRPFVPEIGVAELAKQQAVLSE